MARTLKIRIKSAEKALEGFGKTFKDVEAGRRVKKREGVYFTSIEAARNLLYSQTAWPSRAVRDVRD